MSLAERAGLPADYTGEHAGITYVNGSPTRNDQRGWLGEAGTQNVGGEVKPGTPVIDAMLAASTPTPGTAAAEYAATATGGPTTHTVAAAQPSGSPTPADAPSGPQTPSTGPANIVRPIQQVRELAEGETLIELSSGTAIMGIAYGANVRRATRICDGDPDMYGVAMLCTCTELNGKGLAPHDFDKLPARDAEKLMAAYNEKNG